MRLWYRFWQCASLLAFSVVFRFRFFGREHVPSTGPVLLVSNHQSFLDPILCGVGLRRDLDYIARESLFRQKHFGWFIRSLNAFPIHRDQADVKAIKSVIRRLKNDRAIVLFPEATRSPDGRIRTIKSGFDLIARRSRATVVPVVVDGAFEAWPRHQSFPGPGEIRVVYGRALTPDQIKAMPREELAKQINQTLRQMQAELRSRYGRRPFDYPEQET